MITVKLAHVLRHAAATATLLACYSSAGASSLETLDQGRTCRPDPDGPIVNRSVFARPDTSVYVLPFEPGRTFPDGNDTDLHENYVMVRHADGTVARYLHLTRGGARIAIGDTVAQGQPDVAFYGEKRPSREDVVAMHDEATNCVHRR